MTETMTAEQHREAAEAARKSAAESFERCDTDGFLSQWASGLTAQKHDAEARLLEAGGVMDCMVLFLNGELASTHQGFSQFGEYWVLNDEAAEKFGKRFYSPSKSLKNPIARDRARGFTYGNVLVRAYVDIKGPRNATGLAGAMSVSVGVYPVVEDLQTGNFAILSRDGACDNIDKMHEANA